MLKLDKPLEKCRILVTNDDGINAPGLKVLEKIAKALSKDVWVVAPEQNQSGSAHSLTLRSPLRLREVSKRRYAVDGTPTDCVLLAVNQLLQDHQPDLVLSGVNRGANMAEDVTYSGTIAAAMEGTLLGLPSIALSQAIAFKHAPKWSTAEQHGPDIIRKVLAIGWPKGVLINLNFPDTGGQGVKGIRLARQAQRQIGSAVQPGTDPYGNPYYWVGLIKSEEEAKTGTDLAAVRDGYIAITPIHMDMTHAATLKALQTVLD
ncbi:5'/3'-nucleotidase SurE [Oceanibaculum nanhaiense]|jgi:5'-nucleotidase|uniref:5'/3'-nucleotidase SurE n=1 Tax=Oceanibaculum nanhaiense TaxID=1909734 RepID=UPI000A3BAA89|nr:5'/3'-nucleotidase SurE [Oceanibaculum nanhaiense]MBC7135542.1 5'/3'-nucleotidase SurE [Oceanibaculum nanhaiense]